MRDGEVRGRGRCLELVLCLKTISFSLFRCLSFILMSLNTCNEGFLSNVLEIK